MQAVYPYGNSPGYTLLPGCISVAPSGSSPQIMEGGRISGLLAQPTSPKKLAPINSRTLQSLHCSKHMQVFAVWLSRAVKWR